MKFYKAIACKAQFTVCGLVYFSFNTISSTNVSFRTLKGNKIRKLESRTFEGVTNLETL